MRTLSLAYVAGLVDGEGCITIRVTPGGQGRAPYYAAAVAVGMCVKAKPILEALHRQFGGSLHSMKKDKSHYQQMWRWVAEGPVAADMLEQILPCLELKAEQARLAVRLERAIKKSLPQTPQGRCRWTDHAREHCETIHLRLKELNSADPERRISEMPGCVPVAQRVAGQWVTFQQDEFSDTGWAPFRGTWPVSGSMRSGVLFQRPPQEPPTSASVSGSSPGTGTGRLLPSLVVTDSRGARNSTARRSPGLRAHSGDTLTDAMTRLLPTPAAGNFNDGEDLTSWEARRQRNLAKRINGNGQGTPLPVAIQKLSLFRTPTSQLAVNGGSQHPDKRRAGGHGPTLADEVEHLLPTPAARLGDYTSRGADPARYKGPQSLNGRRSNLDDCIAAIQAGVSWVSARMSGEVVDWGPYARAVLRWAQVLGVLPPHPVEPGRTGMRLSPAFVEWMQGLPAGWVTQVPGLSRNAQLKALGNGVVPQSAALAFAVMLPRVPELCLTR